MRFSPTFLDEIRDRVPISDVIARRVSWDKRKTNVSRADYWACCPFHGEKSPSFHCEDRKGRYHCFGCGVTGDHFRFLTDLEGLSFPEAVQQVADMAGIAMPAADPVAEKRQREQTSLLDVMEMATQYFQEQLQSPSGARARAYLRDRGLTGRTIETFRLGFALDSRNALKEYLAGKNVPKDQIEACGLVVHGSDIPVAYDRFRDRIMFPILSSRDKVIAFGGRAMAPDAPAKYLNSNETELFHKGNVLYNFNRARRASQGADGSGTIIAVEGYMDVIALHQAGIENAVAPLGTALTENQLELLWRMTPQPVLCFDGDAAGIRAANRGVDLALPRLKPGYSVRFAMLPDGKDPDDMVRHEGRAPFDKVMSQARPLAEMVWSREVSSGKFDTPESRAELEARLKQMVSVIADENVRRHYQQDIRDRLNAFFQPQFRNGGNQQGRNFRSGNASGGRAGRNDPRGNGPASTKAPNAISNRLTGSGMVRGHSAAPALRESVLALTIVNHPLLLQDEYDEIASIDYDNRDLQRLWSAMLGTAAALAGPHLTREHLVERLEAQGFAALIKGLDQQVRNARLWTATEEAAIEDAREGYRQALGLHKRTKALRWQKIELEREIADATEAGAEDDIDQLMRALNEIQLEISRMENQEAIIDGFGLLSGRVKAAVTHGG
ncbi:MULTISPECIES: DNA primase [unclassified Rhizobium]|uniref:DNA primase n=1 Tax=unclassified Rhizobium TaxID=2613769 RepID=UPI001ADD0F09|nr:MULTISPECIES: DNA primase [unclassified Rhizobium]MBO9098986.1 DNA primase [Rhizobium sp. L58/93]MBO9132207.1 DNA primase [Rhizobium sp. B209b/85]MBO9169250.1 DNA primase [Rhizobium sp. L245/93]MBO9185201.1 DNA primase [Rhizobium sp. E27B/91]QXZ85352.1 DNA primase [Rhizobium sp. K1/93]